MERTDVNRSAAESKQAGEILPNLEAVKARQKATWESGDFGQIAFSIQHIAEEFMARLPLHQEAQVLDVACCTGNLAVIAARQGCQVHGIDIAGNLIEQARARAGKARLKIDFREADAEALPFTESRFDFVVSMFGVMFTPQPDMFKVFQAHLPPPAAGVPSPMAWGNETTVMARLQNGFTNVRLARSIALMRYPFPPAETVEFFRQYYGPTLKAFASLDATAQAALRRDLVELQTTHNIARTPGTTEVAAEYLEIIATRS
jgi:SAM-dependent methyltransferase